MGQTADRRAACAILRALGIKPRVGRPRALTDERKREMRRRHTVDRVSWRRLRREFGVSLATVARTMREAR